jgi:hypothetical protein
LLSVNISARQFQLADRHQKGFIILGDRPRAALADLEITGTIADERRSYDERAA